MWKTADPGYLPDIDPSELRHRVTFLEQTITQDASGAAIGWAPGNPPLVVSAKIEPMRGTDVIKSGQDVSQVFVTITVRYRSGIVPKMRLQAPSGSVYVIQAAENLLEMNAWLRLTCLGIGANE